MTGYYLLTSILVTIPGLSFPVKSDDDDVQRIGKAVIWTNILKFLDFSILDLKAFSFHFLLREMSEPDFHFTFHFSNFQYPLSQDTGPGISTRKNP